MANGVIIPIKDIKHKTATITLNKIKEYIPSAVLSPTAVSLGSLSDRVGISSQDKILSIQPMQAQLTPASLVSFGMYNSQIYIATSQQATLSSDIVLNIAYID